MQQSGRYWEVQVDAGEMAQGWIFWLVKLYCDVIGSKICSSGLGRQSRQMNGATRRGYKAAGSHKIHRNDCT